MCLVHTLKQSCSEKLSQTVSKSERKRLIVSFGFIWIHLDAWLQEKRAKCHLFISFVSASRLKQERRCQKLPGKTSRCCENVWLETWAKSAKNPAWSAGLDFDETPGRVKILIISYHHVSSIVTIPSIHGARFRSS